MTQMELTFGDVVSVRRFDMDMVESQLRRMFPISQLIAARRPVTDLAIDSVPDADYVDGRRTGSFLRPGRPDDLTESAQDVALETHPI